MGRTLTADSGDTLVEVQLALAQVHLDRREYSNALDLLRAAARARDARAINMLGRAYERGWGVFPDSAHAAVYYREAAEMGDAWAKFNLADLLLRGDGVAQDEHAAYHLYLEASRQGHAKSLNMLGLFYEDGRIVPQDHQAALELYRAGAAQGDCWAHLNAARLLMEADNKEEAFELLARSLAFGFSDYFNSLISLLSTLRDPRADALIEQVKALIQNGAQA